MEEKLIKIEVQTKTITKKDGTSFVAFKGLTKKGWVDLKFRKEVAEDKIPSVPSLIYCNQEDVNINRTKRFPVIWVKSVVRFEELKFEQNIEDYFD